MSGSDEDESSPLLVSLNGAATNDGESSMQLLGRHEKAAWIVDASMRGTRVSSLEAVPPTRANRAVYLFFANTRWIRQVAVLALVMLSFFELPSWCSALHKCSSPDGSNLFLSGIPYLSPGIAISVNVVLLSVLIFFAILDIVYSLVPLHIHGRLLFPLLAVLVVDFLYVLLFSGYPPFRFAPYLRALLPIFYWNSFRECTLSSFAVIGPFFDVVFFVIVFTLLFGWVVTLFFHDVPAADQYFGNLMRGLYSAFTALTTADWPMQVMGVLDVSRISALLFIGFIVIGVFLLFNVLLAVVYNAYTSHIEGLVLDKLQSRRESLEVAYDTLRGEEESVGLPDVTTMFQELRKNKRHSHLSDNVIDMVFTALDDDADETLSRQEFLDVVDVLQLKFVIELEYLSPMEQFMPGVYNTRIWQKIAGYVRSESFTYVVDAFMLFNVVVVLFETTMDLRGKDTPTSLFMFSLIECAFSIVYLMEMGLKIACLGFSKYWSDVGNRFDFWVTWLLLGATFYVLLPFTDNDSDIIRLFILLRCLRLFTLMADIPRFRRLVQVFSVLIPASVPLFSLFFLSLYVFAAIGTEAFGGLIYLSNPSLNPITHPLVDAYVSNDYWVLNFNDMASAWFTLFSSVIVAYLTEIAEAVAATSQYGEWTKWFFIVSFIVNTLIVSNCVVAFVVDLFVMEDEGGEDEEILLKDMEGRYGTRRVKILQMKNTAHQVYASMFRERIDEILQEHNAEQS